MFQEYGSIPPMKNHELKILSVLLVTIAAAMVVLSKNRGPGKNAPDAALAPGQTYTIELRGDGFYPKGLTIHQGDSVTFVTKSGNYFWPASNLHPTHLLYPEFDPREPIDPKQSWSFTFTKIGTWEYHDHLSPYFTGTITVVGVNSAPASGNPCTEGKRIDCLRQSLLKTLETKGVDAAFDEIARFYNDNKEVPTACHDFAHEIGHAAYKLYLKNKDSVLTPKAAYCANGFYHGFMGSFLDATRSPDMAREFCAYVQTKLASSAPDAALQCFHGIGHGAMDITVGERKGSGEHALVDPALMLCERASRTKEQLYRCASGAFNALANFYIHGEYGLKARKDDPLWLCREEPEKYQESCYGNLNSLLFWMSENDLQAAAKFVEGIREDAYAIPAMRYLANLSTLYFAKSDPTGAVQVCRTVQPRLHTACIEGFAHGFLEGGSPGKEYLDALSFCRFDGLTPEERDTCFKYALSNLGGWYSREKSAEICRSVEENYRTYCAQSPR